ncbi:ROK family transcriptional regulator [Microbacterium sp. nov. GSS16]|uniref:ROK family transcriptional regulator n=1 Tax=Microbacterium sp. nov. GSS16 TaxID=3019890 RepID=UPI0023059AE1|nr:ROK family transcriptional regulator [Microbacterium sp. nov. GSS16]WCD92778.1 ROK family transcriptional regulator [Microbacterium sp. nov. GSS16]
MNSSIDRRSAATAPPIVSGSFGGARGLRATGKVLPEQARSHNRSLVLQTLYHRGEMSRADLSRETGLTRVTISDLVGECIADGIVREIGVREAAGPGKPPIVIDIDRDGHQIIGVDLSGTDSFQGAVLNLDGEMLHRRTVSLPVDVGAEQAYAGVVRLVRELIADADRPVLGIGVGSPGIVRTDGTVLSAPNLSWSDLPLEQRMHEEFALPVLVRNDANAAVLAEYTFGAARSDLMLIRIGRGVGAGLIAGGQAIIGGRFAAGEIGHVVTGTDEGPLCACGNRGCLEAWVSVPHLQGMIDAEPARRAEILAQAGARLGIALAPIVAALDLSQVVLAGPRDLLAGDFVEAATRMLHARTLDGVFADVDIRLTEQADIVLRGAAVMVLSAQLGVS